MSNDMYNVREVVRIFKLLTFVLTALRWVARGEHA